jgi:hypothetical protein
MTGESGSGTPAHGEHALVDGVDVDAVDDAVLRCAHVAVLGSGLAGGAATYLPGRRIEGVRVTDDALELEVRMAWGSTADQLGSQVRAAVAPLAAGKRVDVSITDIVEAIRPTETPGETFRESETP